MVKTFGPALSKNASGTIADAITFSNWKGRGYLRKKSLPKDPKTMFQTAQRLMMTWLANEWATLTEPQQSTWHSDPSPSANGAYNHFMQTNLARISQFLSPIKAYPAGEIETPPTFLLDRLWPIARPTALDMTGALDVLNDPWGYFIFADRAAGFTPAKENLAAVVTQYTNNWHYTTIRDLKPGLWRTRARSFTTDGVMGPATLQQVALVRNV